MNTSTQPAPFAPAFQPPSMVTLTNTSKQARHFVLLDHRIAASEIERDPTKMVKVTTLQGEAMVAQPVLYGPDRQPVGTRNIPPHRATTRQLRELHVDIAAGASVQVPRMYITSLLAIACELCATPTAGLGCKHVDDPEHVEAWTIKGARLACIGWCEIVELKHVRVDASYVASLETATTDGPHNSWGNPNHGRR